VVFTGQTVVRNGGPQAVAHASVTIIGVPVPSSGAGAGTAVLMGALIAILGVGAIVLGLRRRTARCR
jgi:hypothetical protein